MGIPTEGLEEPFTWPNADTEDTPHARRSIYRLVPSMQGYRNNLTALSQGYNLYFVAYQGHIFVYVPRCVPKQTIPQAPDFKIYPRPSKEAIAIGGTVDVVTPHTINHIITGYLGDEEIVLACYDDGDVVAYYVKDIADSIEKKRNELKGQGSSRKAYTSRPPKLLFHENVGLSAWAAGPNHENPKNFATAARAATALSRGSLGEREIGEYFLDDVDGQAEKVCAVDIRGVLWIADIWRMFQPVTEVPPSDHHALQSEEFWPASSRGWGVLPLNDDSFLPVNSVEEMFGLPERALNISMPGSGCPQPMVNITDCLAAIPDNPCPPAAGARSGQFYHYVPVMLHDESLHSIVDANAAGFTDSESDESETEPEATDNQINDVNEFDDDEDDDDEEEEEEEEEGGGGGVAVIEDVIIASGVPQIIDADEDDSLMPFSNLPLAPLAPPGEPFQQALQDLDEALGQLAYAVQEFQDAISSPDTPEPIQQDQDKTTPKHGRRRNFDSGFSGQHNYSQFNTPPVRLDMAFFPHSGKIQTIPGSSAQLLAFLRRPIEFNENPGPPVAHRTKDVTKRYRFIRTYEKDLELRSLRGEIFMSELSGHISAQLVA
ncbi:hypothetical protein TASIC1_0003020000 [Trichoderma asperellum]|uniref:Uncharacterized protein n=1 Tax=Trichoderma asperellum TaxID=101201 RepID=A0A6V8QNT6_TRIAP|nr:hypothetical protein TASIC1_0003020000 [Trichoderma asperellum]